MLFSPVTEKELKLKEVVLTCPRSHNNGSVWHKNMILNNSLGISKLFCTYTHSGKEILNTHSNIKLVVCAFHHSNRMQ